MPSLRPQFRHTGTAALTLALVVAAPAMATGQAADKVITSVRADAPPSIDGQLDDPVWRKARFASGFRQQIPVENGPPSVRTEVAFAYDQDNLYVAARMFIAGPGQVEAVMTRRDDTGSAERIIISLDTFSDRRTAYSFAVTAAGGRADWHHPDDASSARDASFDPVWQAEVAHGSDRWTAEMRIPFSQLRFRSSDEIRWGVNINRFIPHKNEDLFWVVVPRRENAWSSYFGVLEGIRDIRPTRRIELLPYVAGDLTHNSAGRIDPDDPFADPFEVGGRIGIDAKMGVGPSLTLDATINPDFGQVEADPAVVNLSAFEPIFAERRPFFVEGSQLFAAVGPQYYYSRRIGAPPRGAIDADYADVPPSTRILGAAKLTGKLPSRLSVGALSALTQPVTVDAYDLAADQRSRVPIEPLTSYNVLRLQQEFGKSASRVGAMATGVYRHFDSDSGYGDQFTRYATTGVIDGIIRTDDARYELISAVGFSAIGGESAAISAIQQNSTHYFQRPDQDHVELDPDAESLTGWTALLAGGKRSGSWRWGSTVYAESPGFEINDIGLLQAADDIGLDGGITYVGTDSGRHLHGWELGGGLFEEWNFGGDRAPAWANARGAVTLANFWRLGSQVNVATPGFDDSATRGGPLMERGWHHDGALTVDNPFAARTRISGRVGYDASQTGFTGVNGSVEVTLRPVDALQLSLTPIYLHGTDDRQYVGTIDGAGGATFGSRYVFGTVERRELAIRARARMGFSPDLGLEIYLEPFVSSGRYVRFGELAAAGSRQLRHYGSDGTTIAGDGEQYQVSDGANSFVFDDPDFQVLSLRSTAVLRWEFAPGSTLFLVWQQDRGEARARAEGIDQLADSLTAPGQNTLAVKVSYWLPVD